MDTNTANSTNGSKRTFGPQSLQQIAEEKSLRLEEKTRKIKELEKSYGIILTPSEGWDENIHIPPEVASNTGTGKPSVVFTPTVSDYYSRTGGPGGLPSVVTGVRSYLKWHSSNPPNIETFMNAHMFGSIASRNLSAHKTNVVLIPEGEESKIDHTTIPASIQNPLLDEFEARHRFMTVQKAFTELDEDASKSFAPIYNVEGDRCHVVSEVYQLENPQCTGSAVGAESFRDFHSYIAELIKKESEA